ncbi:MAG TPA: DUF3105 domain-containing protein [Enhygromyxa sp.]|nr:DUF3105 domain-containing protein [Enhygromyxa sp.]
MTACTNDDGGDDDLGQAGSESESNTGMENGDGDGDDPPGDGDGDDPTGDGDDPTGDGDGDDPTGDGDGDETDTDDPPCPPSETSEAAGCAEIVGQGFCSEGAMHVPEGSDIDWINNPPHSGPHYPSWSTKGEHAEAVARGNWVHNLEHGWVVFVHNCPGACEAELDVLRDAIAMRANASILMTPDPLLDGPRFAAISWTWVHEFDAPDLDELLCFVDQHFDNAPESVP